MRQRWIVLAATIILLTVAGWRLESWLDDQAALDSGYLPTVLAPESARGWRETSTTHYDRWRGRRLLRRVARDVTSGAQTDRERLERLLEWTFLHVRPSTWAAPGRVHFDDPYRTLKRGFGYCDQSAHVLAEMARLSGFEARLFFLRNAKSDSPHTVAQVLLNGEWMFVDTLVGRLLEADGSPLTLDILRDRPELLEHAYEGARLTVSADDFLRGEPPYGGELPWRRVPDPPLLSPEFPVAERDGVLAYDEFRQAMLHEAWTRADALYDELARMPLPKELAQGAAYHATLAAYDAGDWDKTLQRARDAVSSDPDTPWRGSYYELSGLAYERIGNVEAALEAYAAADLPSTRVRAQRLAE